MIRIRIVDVGFVHVHPLAWTNLRRAFDRLHHSQRFWRFPLNYFEGARQHDTTVVTVDGQSIGSFTNT
jgi:hypothetical protein